ncbi:MAG: hypothetical protein FWC66_06300 [Oscillospiraceae bacterium]|nr:hypothetical protein [Oscillospiraceae bacterium]
MNKIKKYAKTILIAALAVMMIFAVTACNDGDVPEDVRERLPRAERETEVANGYDDEDDYEDTSLIASVVNAYGLIDASMAFSDALAYDYSIVITFGPVGSPVLTLDMLLEMLEEMVILAMDDVDVDYTAFVDALENHSFQFRMVGSQDENLNAAVQIGLPMDSGEFFELLDIVFVDSVLYIGIASYLDLVDYVFDVALDLIELEGLSSPEVNMVVLMVEGIMARLSSIDYVSIDLSVIPGFEDFEAYMQSSLDMQDDIIALFEIFAEAITQRVGLAEIASLDMISRDGDWFILEFDESQAQVMLEALLEIIDENADDVADIVNQIMESMSDLYEDLYGIQFDEVLSAQDLRTVLMQYDPSFFNEFTGQFVYRVRADANVQESEITAIITVPHEDLSILFSIETQLSPRTSPITAPPAARVATGAELLEMTGLGDLIDMDMIMAMAPGMSFDVSTPAGITDDAAGIVDGENDPILVGTWSWDMDDSYTYVFNADGTGTRGFTGATETFVWSTDDDLLVIGLEQWTFTISDGVFTIDSRQVAGMTFSYNRVD